MHAKPERLKAAPKPRNRATSGDPGDVRAVMDSIRRIVRALRVSSRAAEKTVGLSGAQLFVLQTLEVSSPMSVNELADRTRTHQSSVSVVVSRLVDAGLVARVASRADARRAELSVTAAGRRILKSAPVAPQEKLVRALGTLKPADLHRLQSLLAELITSAELEHEPASMFFEEEISTHER